MQDAGEDAHTFWRRIIEELGGGGLFVKTVSPPPSGAEFPKHLYGPERIGSSGKIEKAECIVYDEEEQLAAQRIGFGNEALGIRANEGVQDAPEEGKEREGGKSEYRDGDACGETAETSSGNSTEY